MLDAEFGFSGQSQALPNGRMIVRGCRTSSEGRPQKHVFIEVECLLGEAPAVQQAIAVLLRRHGRINASAF